MKKVKVWLKEHKKEIIVGAVAAGGTALYFLAKQKKITGVKAGLSLNLRFLEGEEDIDGCFGRSGSRDLYASVNLNNPDLTFADLGKLGDMLKEKLPMIAGDVKVDHLSANYSLLRK